VKHGSFASAHVFPGGHVSPQDGDIPPHDDVRRHEDSETYRLAAIRECFEESGILLAKCQSNLEEFMQLSEEERDEGREIIHSEKIHFRKWLEDLGCVPDMEGLVPFTRWLTPANIPKRFSTQMYLYFLPLDSPLAAGQQSSQIHTPMPDGGIEHTAAHFAYAEEWIRMSQSEEIVVFPPQFFLLTLVAAHLSAPVEGQNHDNDALRGQRQRLLDFVRLDGDPSWGQKCISPDPIRREKNKYLIMGLANAGPELEGTGRRGDTERVITVALDKEVERGRQRPRSRDVLWRRDVFGDEKERL